MTLRSVVDIGAPVELQVPDDECCNCGTSQGLVVVDTPLVATRFFGLAGSEHTLTVGFPYCGDCESTATRLPTGLLSKLMIAFGVFWALILLTIFALPASMNPGALAIAVVALVATFGAYALRRPKAPRTSSAQPVTLRKLEQKFSGEIEGITLRFSNDDYARRFETLNQAPILAGAIRIERPGSKG